MSIRICSILLQRANNSGGHCTTLGSFTVPQFRSTAPPSSWATPFYFFIPTLRHYEMHHLTVHQNFLVLALKSLKQVSLKLLLYSSPYKKVQFFKNSEVPAHTPQIYKPDKTSNKPLISNKHRSQL